MFKFFWIVFFLSVFGYCAEYIIPPEFDNTVQSTESAKRYLITNNSVVLSTQVRSLGGVPNLRYKCVLVPRLSCINKQSVVSEFGVGELSLRGSDNKLVKVYATELFAEDDSAFPNEHKICGGAVGGVTWDYINAGLSLNGNNLVLDLVHRPLGGNRTYHFFTNAVYNPANTATTYGAGGSGSYMVVHAKVTCL